MHDTTSFFVSHGFCRPFVFITLRIAFHASPLYSHRYELPGGVPPVRVPASVARCVALPAFVALCFQQLARSFSLLDALFAHASLCFQWLADSFAKTPGWGYQRGRGRSGGRAVSARGRMRKRGPSGGGTLRRESPQHGQRPSSQNARVASARSQWPRASHCGLMHCTVKPGRNCMSFPPGRPARSCGAGRVARTQIP